jgi:hypothetical protein
MKRLLLVLMLLLGVGLIVPGMVMASDGVDVYQLTLTTYPVTGATGVADAAIAAMPFNSGGTKRITRIELVYFTTATADTVTFYDTATSSAVITSKWTWSFQGAGANTAGAWATKTYDFVGGGSNISYLKITDLYATKSNANDTVYLNYWYLK